MDCNSFTIRSDNGFFDFPLPGESPFSVRLSLRGVDAVAEMERIAAEEPFASLSQVHGARVIAAEEAPLWPQREKADGFLVRRGSPVVGLRYGDCAPVVILSLSGDPWLLALHSGFKGTLQNIVAAGISFAESRCGRLDAEKLFAWVGPCISGACYTRRMDDPSTAEALRLFAADAVTPGGEFAHIDLKRQIARQLADCGVPCERIFVETQCTCCQADLFYSHRRSVPGNDPRMLLTVRPKFQ